MGKNANKKAKFKPIIFEVQKSRFNKAVKNALKSVYGSYTEKTILNGINFKIEGENLTLASTNGNILIKQELKIDEFIAPGEYQITLSGQHIEKANIKTSYEFGRKKHLAFMDKIKITINEDSAVFEDLLNGISYQIPALGSDSCKYPDYEKVIPNVDKNKNYIKIGFNTSYFAKFAEISNPRTKEAVLAINKENQLSAMLIMANNQNDDIKTTAILMPMRIDE